MFDILFEGNNLFRLLHSLWTTLYIAFVSVFFSAIFGCIFGILMSFNNVILKIFFNIYLESIRIIPPIVWLFVVYFGFPQISSFSPSSIFSSFIVFILWGSIELADLVRGVILSIPRHRFDSARALGFTNISIFYYIILKEIIIKVLPSFINLSTRIIKTTSILPLIGVIELIKTSQQIIEFSSLKYPDAAFYMYALAFVCYFIICYPLSYFALFLQKKFAIK